MKKVLVHYAKKLKDHMPKATYSWVSTRIEFLYRSFRDRNCARGSTGVLYERGLNRERRAEQEALSPQNQS